MFEISEYSLPDFAEVVRGMIGKERGSIKAVAEALNVPPSALRSAISNLVSRSLLMRAYLLLSTESSLYDVALNAERNIIYVIYVPMQESEPLVDYIEFKTATGETVRLSKAVAELVQEEEK